MVPVKTIQTTITLIAMIALMWAGSAENVVGERLPMPAVMLLDFPTTWLWV